MRKHRGRDVSVLAGAVLAFFGVFASIMADGLWSGRRGWVLCVVLAYGVLGLAAGFGSSSRMVGLWMSLPAALILTAVFMSEGHELWYIGYLALIVLFAWLGAAVGVQLRTRRRPPR